MKQIKWLSLRYQFLTLVCCIFISLCFLENCNQNSSQEQVAFKKVYDEKKWGEGSGIGSWPENAGPYLKLLQEYLNDPKYQTIVDLGCGDWRLMETMIIPEEKNYVGYDLVPSLMEQNTKKYSKNVSTYIKIPLIRSQKTLFVESNHYRMKHLILLLSMVSLSLLISCDHFSQHFHHDDHTASAEMPELNQGKRWLADSPTRDGFATLRKMVPVSINPLDEITNYNTRSNEMIAEINKIFVACKMTGEGHNELHKYIALLLQDLKPMQGNDLEAAQKAQEKLSKDLDAFVVYFE